MFSTHYADLLRAIVNGNYEALETLCEGRLTEEIAAKVFEFEKHRAVQFRIVGDEDLPST